MKKISILILPGLMFAVACKRNFLDVNKDPNNPTRTTASVVMANALNTAAAGNGANPLPLGKLGAMELGSYWCGHWSPSGNFSGFNQQKTYNFSSSDFNFWTGIYDNLGDFEFVIKNASNQNARHLTGMAKIMKAYNFQMLTDMYGNLPYTEALKGLEVIQPKFDDAKTIYEALVKLIDEAIADLKTAPAVPSEPADIYCNGNKNRWIRFGNTLKLRLLIRQSRIPGRDTYIKDEINKIVAEGSGFLAEGESISSNPGYVKSVNKINQFYFQYGYDANDGSTGAYVRMSKDIIDSMKAMRDTFRLRRIASPPDGKPDLLSNYRGVALGEEGPSAQNVNNCGIGPSLIVQGDYGKPVVIMSSSEGFFLQAEAKERYGAVVNIGTTAQVLYETAVREHFKLTGVPNAAAAAAQLLSSGNAHADYSAAPDKLKCIYVQKWIALANYNGFEAWCEMRRTNVPRSPISLRAQSPVPPVRLYYPLIETVSNGDNVAAQGVINVFTSRLFWDID
jgi:Starch-binding associating with outer membrane